MRGIAFALCWALGVGAAAAAPSRPPTILQVYPAAETTTSASVVWNTDTASDSLLQYSMENPIPTDAPRIYLAASVTYHEIALSGLTPGALYHFRVTSCTRRGCGTGSGSLETFPSCPDEVPAISGSWETAATPNVGGSTPLTNQLLGITTVFDDEAWAVGWAQDPAAPPYVKRPLTLRFDGRGWTIPPTPHPGQDIQSVLYAVSGISPMDVWAVGSSHDGTLPSRSLIAHWDEREWRLVPSPSPDGQLNELRGVAALSTSDAWAVGFRGGTAPETPLETLILHWDGAFWGVIPSPNVPGGANQLSGITAIAPNDLWAVGNAAGGPLAMHWDGTAWTVTPLPVGSGLSTEQLTAVSGAARDDVWAVGSGKGIFSNQTFATLRHWDGKRWTERVCRAASASNPPDGYEGGGPDAYFTGVSASARDDVWAVGVRGSGPMVLHWDGFAWTSVVHPRAYPNAAILRAVATSRLGAWSAGGVFEVSPSGSTSPERTRVDRYTP